MWAVASGDVQIFVLLVRVWRCQIAAGNSWSAGGYKHRCSDARPAHAFCTLGTTSACQPVGTRFTNGCAVLPATDDAPCCCCCCLCAVGLLQHMPGLGIRSIRYSMLVDDGIIKVLNIEEAGERQGGKGAGLLQYAAHPGMRGRGGGGGCWGAGAPRPPPWLQQG
jgi:hypothetical protein